jgi:hypothetical protein
MNTKLFISVLLFLAIVAFGILFWVKFFVSQEDLASSPLLNSRDEIVLTGKQSSELSTLERELDEVEVNNVDEYSAELKAEASEL